MRKVLKQLQQMPPKFNQNRDKDKLLWRQAWIAQKLLWFLI
jgi:hypothetical protein